MVSTGVQAELSDPEGALGVIKSIYGQLKDLRISNQSLLDSDRERDERIQTSNRLANQLTERLSELFNSTNLMIESIEDNAASVSNKDQILQDLINEKERLDVATNHQKLDISDTDILNEERLTGFVEEEISRKIEELSNLHKRLSDAREEYRTEWAEFKSDLQQYDSNKASYISMSDHLQELKLAKCVGLHSGSSSGELVKRVVEHHLNQITYRDLQTQLRESRLEERDLELEIGDLVKQKQQLWKRCLDLERTLEDIQGTDEANNTLRPAAAFSSLPDVCEGIDPASTGSDLDLTEQESCHGRMLHRCHKNIDLVVVLSEEDIQEETTVTTIEADDTQTSRLEQTPEMSTSTSDSTADDNEEPTEEETEQETDQNAEQSQQATSAVQTGIQTTTDIGDVKELDVSTSFLKKMRKRVGLSGRSSSSQKIKGVSKLTATGSTRHFDPINFLKRRK